MTENGRGTTMEKKQDKRREVGFRWRAMQAAKDLHLTGWVRNMYNGNVEMEVQGNGVMIERLFQELNSDRFIRIEKTEILQIPTVEGESEFSVRG